MSVWSRARSMFSVAAVGLLAVLPANASPIPGLFATGTNGSGGVLTDGAADLHYAVLSSTNPNYNGSPFGTVVNQSSVPGTWVPNTTTTRWISDNATAATPLGPTVTYRLTFDLTGFDPKTASFSALAAADDTAKVLLNGVSIGVVNGFRTLTEFKTTSGFVTGINTLDFVVVDTAAVVSGLFVSPFTSDVSVPAPSGVAFLALGGLLTARRRRGGTDIKRSGRVAPLHTSDSVPPCRLGGSSEPILIGPRTRAPRRRSRLGE